MDLLLLHGPNAAFNTTTPCSDFVCGVNNAQWKAYEQALADGKTQAIGVSELPSPFLVSVIYSCFLSS